MKNEIIPGVKWAGRPENGGTKSRPMIIIYNGVKKDIHAWAKKLDLSYDMLRKNMKLVKEGALSFDDAMLSKKARDKIRCAKARQVKAKSQTKKIRNEYMVHKALDKFNSMQLVGN